MAKLSSLELLPWMSSWFRRLPCPSAAEKGSSSSSFLFAQEVNVRRAVAEKFVERAFDGVVQFGGVVAFCLLSEVARARRGEQVAGHVGGTIGNGEEFEQVCHSVVPRSQSDEKTCSKFGKSPTVSDVR